MRLSIILLLGVIHFSSYINAQKSGDMFLGITSGAFVSSLKNNDTFISRNKSNVGISIGATFERHFTSGLSWAVKFRYYLSVGGQLNYRNINAITLLNDDIPIESRTSFGDTDIRYFIDYLELTGSVRIAMARYGNIILFAEPHVGILHPVNGEGAINRAEKIDVMPSVGFDVFHGGLALGINLPLKKPSILSKPPRTFFTTSLQYRFTLGSDVLFGRNILIDGTFDNSTTSMGMFNLFVGIKTNIGNEPVVIPD